MKRILFVSKSKLAQNLMTLIIKSVPRKIHFQCFDDTESANHYFFPKQIHLVIVDKNAVKNFSEKPFEHRSLKNAKVLFIHTRHDPVDREQLKKLGLGDPVIKPFLAEELIDLVEKKLGYGHE